MEQIIRLSQLQFNRPGSDFPSLHLFPRKVCDCISPGWQLSREEMTESAGGLQPSKSGKKNHFFRNLVELASLQGRWTRQLPMVGYFFTCASTTAALQLYLVVIAFYIFISPQKCGCTGFGPAAHHAELLFSEQPHTNLFVI